MTDRGEGNGTPLQYSCPVNPMDGGAWWAAVHGVEKSQTRLRDFTFTFHFHALEKEMATQSSILAWRIPGTVEPDGLLSMGLHRVTHDWSDLAAAAGHPQKINLWRDSMRHYRIPVLSPWFGKEGWGKSDWALHTGNLWCSQCNQEGWVLNLCWICSCDFGLPLWLSW